MSLVLTLIFSSVARGFMRSSQGNPDEARAARFVLKDYVNAKLLYAHAPPDIEKDVYMAISRDRAKERLRLAGKKLAPTTRVAKGADTFVAPQPISASSLAAAPKSNKVRNLDNDFFENSSSLAARPMFQGTARNGQELSRVQLYPHQNMMADDGIVSTNGGREIDGGKSKKHHKGNKRVKQRSGKGYD
jgi:large subunit GTPase 1